MRKSIPAEKLADHRTQLARQLEPYQTAEEAPEAALLNLLLLEHETLAGRDGFSREPSLLWQELVRQSPDLARQCYAAEIAWMEKIAATGTEQLYQDPLGMWEGGFPIKLQGRLWGCLWSGKFRETAFTKEDGEAWSKATGLGARELRSLQRGVPVLARGQIEEIWDACRGRVRALEQALVLREQCGHLKHMLLQSERSHALGSLSGGLAHHFNSLLSIILGYSSSIANRHKLPAPVDESLRKIMDAAQRGRRLTEEMQAFVGEEGGGDARCSVHEVIRRALSVFGPQVKSNVRVECDFKAADDTVPAPPMSMQHIIFNLITNAVDSMPEGGEVRLATSNETLAPEGPPGKNYLQICVTDTTGALPKGFAAGTPSAAHLHETDLSGMKLSTVYGMVEKLEGTVTLDAQPGAYTTVRILLPLVPATAAHAESSASKTRHGLAPARVWVLDDDEIFCAMCSQLLGDEGHEVTVITSAREFRERIKVLAEPPQLIVMDFSMPDYNGLQLCQFLADRGVQVPVILVSGFAGSQPDIRKALQIKRTRFLQKPFSARELYDAVALALGETLVVPPP